MSKPLFNLGDRVVMKVNGKMIHCTIMMIYLIDSL